MTQHAVSDRISFSEIVDTCDRTGLMGKVDKSGYSSQLYGGNERHCKAKYNREKRRMEWPSRLFALFKILPPNLQGQQNVPINIAIRHAPKIRHTGLCPVLVHILGCSYKGRTRVPQNIKIRG